MADLLVYGSYGYTGSLVAQQAVEEGLDPVLAGRDAEQVERQATELGCDHRTFSLRHPTVVEDQVAGFDVVLNCAGPFAETADPMIEGCLTAGTDYLDLAGSIDVLESIAERDRTAEKTGIVLLPAVGFDVVPMDCLAGFLHEELPSATNLTLALDGLGTFSPGTVKSIVRELDRPGAVRVGGAIRPMPPAWRTRRIDFGQGPKPAVTVPWGDVSTAYYTTGIPNIQTYATVPPYAATAIRRGRRLFPLLGSGPVKRVLTAAADRFVSGPTAAERAGSVTRIRGEVEDDEGHNVAARMNTPDTYDVTARVAVAAARRVLVDDVSPGFQTPASAFGPEFALEIEGIDREVVGPRATA